MLTSRQDKTLLDWLNALPDEIIRTRPVLSVYSALALVSVDLAAAEVHLQTAERLLKLLPLRASESKLQQLRWL